MHLSAATRWCCRKRFRCARKGWKGWNCIHVFTVSAVKFRLHSTWYVSDWTLINPCFITRWSILLFYDIVCLFSSAFFLPSWAEQRKMSSPVVHVCLMHDNNIYCHSEDRIHRAQGETSETGLEWWCWTMKEGGCQVLWCGILLPTPTTRSPFLPAMYCSLRLSLYEPRLLKEARQNNETMRLQRAVPVRGTLDMRFVTPPWCPSGLISLTFSCNSNLTYLCVRYEWEIHSGFKITSNTDVKSQCFYFTVHRFKNNNKMDLTACLADSVTKYRYMEAPVNIVL